MNGLAVPPADPAALAAALVRLLGDPQAWYHYAQAGVRSVRERFGWDRVAAATADAYAAALTRQNGADPGKAGSIPRKRR